MKHIYASTLLFFMLVTQMYAADIQQDIDKLDLIIENSTELINVRTSSYELDRQNLERKFNILRQLELEDCNTRWVSCIDSFAQKKYEPLLDTLKDIYLTDVEAWQDTISKASFEIKDIREAELKRQQELLDVQIHDNFKISTSSSLINDTTQKQIDIVQLEIAWYQGWQDEVSTTYERDKQNMQARFDKERQSELDDCERRKISCASSHAKRKYEPLFEELERDYFKESFSWSEKIRLAQKNIRDILTDQDEQRAQALADRSDDQVREDTEVELLIKQSSIDYEKGQEYFNLWSYKNAIVFYQKACLVEYAQLFKCNFGIARSHEELKDYDKALIYYELAVQQSYTSEDSLVTKQKMAEVKRAISLLSKLNSALDKFHRKIDAKYEWLVLKWKLDFYDEIILKVGKKRSSTNSEELWWLIDMVLVSFRDARKKIKADINDLYN